MASKKPSGLGRGLGALLGDDVMNADAQTVTTLPIAEVESNSAQPRKYFDDAALAAVSYTHLMGLPVLRLSRMLEYFGISLLS